MENSLYSLINLEDLQKTLLRIEEGMKLLEHRLLLGQTAVEKFEYHYWATISNFLSRMDNWIHYSLFEIAQVPITLYGIFKFFLILWIASLFSKILRRTLRKVILSSPHYGESIRFVLTKILHYIVMTLAFIIAIASLGLTLSNLAIVLGALGIGIGFGLQNLVNNFICGLSLLLEGNVKVGDYVELDSGQYGKVTEINVLHTGIHTFDGLDISVPNADLVVSKFTNWTKKDPFQRLHIPFSVAYGTDQEKVKTLIAAAAKEVKCTVLGPKSIPEPDVWLVGFGDNALNLELVVWVNMYQSIGKTSMRSMYFSAIEQTLKDNGIQIPFPQRDLHLKSVDRLAAVELRASER